MSEKPDAPEPTPELQDAYDAGRDAAIHGPNQTNCHFRYFATAKQARAWERGNKSWRQEKGRK